MRRRATRALILFLGLGTMSMAPALALDGTLTVRIKEAIAFKEDTDGLVGSEQDFWICGGIDNVPATPWAPEIGDRDQASWSPRRRDPSSSPG